MHIYYSSMPTRPDNPKDLLSQLARSTHGGLLTVATASKVLNLPAKDTSNLLGRLVRRGWLARAHRGLYLIKSLEADSGSAPAIEDPWILAREMFSPCYIGGWSAAEHWGLTEQIFRPTFVATATGVRKTVCNILGSEFRLAKVSPRRIKGGTLVWRGPEKVMVSDRERTIADGLTSPDWVGGVRHLADILTTYRQSPEWNPGKLLERMDEIGKGSAYKRLGCLAEPLRGAKSLVETALARRSAGVIKLDPSVSSKGQFSKRWGLWINVALPGTETP